MICQEQSRTGIILQSSKRGAIIKLNFSIIVIVFFTYLSGQSYINNAPGNIKKTAEYYYTSNEEDTIQINLWGEIKNPGTYYLDQEVDLITLISLAGGPTQNANFSKIKIINNQNDKIKSVNISEYINRGKDSDIPYIKNGSTVIIAQKTSRKIYHYLSWVTRILSIFSVYFMIRYYYISG
ncbi:MAG: hypothetical protein K9M80_02810 [Candidatus Marinimicrobia bacterium]|nr:hypothetical protein [Candidatus Neomarinimicrobiota bacterium]